tara:strand:- start:470 stop:1480 length:1011 start_codon:yes stop_codon:yes gene_type:complete
MAKNLLQMAQPASTDVHSNIDNLILQAELDRLDQTGVMYADKTPQYIGGADDVVANVALGPLLTLKSLGGVGKKLLEKTGLRNPVTHYTTGSGATEILKSGTIRGRSQAFPGKPFKKDSKKAIDARLKEFREKTLASADELDFYANELIQGSPAVSVTRDPMFLSRPHAHVGSDIGLIMDRGQLIKQGMKIQPFAEAGYRKTVPLYGGKTLGDIAAGKLYRTGSKVNPKFEFEERIRGYVPTENVKLIDLTRLPSGQSNDLGKIDVERFKTLLELARSNKPIIKSFEAKEGLQKTLNILKNPYFKEQGINTPDYIQATEQLLNTPTYRFQPFSKVR